MNILYVLVPLLLLFGPNGNGNGSSKLYQIHNSHTVILKISITTMVKVVT